MVGKSLSHEFEAFIDGARRGNLDAIEFGVARGWANKVDEDGETAIYKAIRARSVEGVAALAKASDKSAVDDLGRTPLVMAATYGSAAMVNILMEGSDASAKNKAGETALMAAIHVGRLDNIAALLPTAIQDHAGDGSKKGPLMSAAYWMPVQVEGIRVLSESAAIEREKMFERIVIQIMSTMLSTSSEDKAIVEEVASRVELADEHGRTVLAPAMRAKMRSMIESEAIGESLEDRAPELGKTNNRVRI